MRTFLFGAVLSVLLSTAATAPAQTPYVRKVLTVNSGKFEFAPPYTDFVNLQAYNPATGAITPAGSIGCQSAQSMVISGHVAWVAAQDSIVKYDLTTLKRMGAVADSGLNQLAIANGRLLVSKQFPVTTFFVEVLDTATLAPVARVAGISGDCAGITMASDTVYVAVNGGWMGTGGKLAVIDPSGWTLKTEVDFGAPAIGIFNLYNYQGKVFSVNKTPYGVVNLGSITSYNPAGRQFNNVVLHHTIGSGAGIRGNLLYLGMDYGIGSFNMSTLIQDNDTLVPDPGSAFFRYITSAAVDTLSNLLYINIGDYTTPGTCLVTTLTGDSVTSYPTGISSDAVAIDYGRYGTGAEEHSAPAAVVVYPNPVRESATVLFRNGFTPQRLVITDLTGRVLFERAENSPVSRVTIPCGRLAPGLYHLSVESENTRTVVPFVKE